MDGIAKKQNLNRGRKFDDDSEQAVNLSWVLFQMMMVDCRLLTLIAILTLLFNINCLFT